MDWHSHGIAMTDDVERACDKRKLSHALRMFKHAVAQHAKVAGFATDASFDNGVWQQVIIQFPRKREADLTAVYDAAAAEVVLRLRKGAHNV